MVLQCIKTTPEGPCKCGHYVPSWSLIFSASQGLSVARLPKSRSESVASPLISGQVVWLILFMLSLALPSRSSYFLYYLSLRESAEGCAITYVCLLDVWLVREQDYSETQLRRPGDPITGCTNVFYLTHIYLCDVIIMHSTPP